METYLSAAGRCHCLLRRNAAGCQAEHLQTGGEGKHTCDFERIILITIPGSEALHSIWLYCPINSTGHDVWIMPKGYHSLNIPAERYNIPDKCSPGSHMALDSYKRLLRLSQECVLL